MNATIAAVTAKVEAVEDMHPFLFGAFVALAGLLLAASAFPSRRGKTGR